MNFRSPKFKIALAFAVVYIVWGSTYIAIRFAIETIPPFLMAGMRFLTAGSILYLFASLKDKVKPSLRHWKSAFIIGALLLLGGNGLVVWAEKIVPTGITALIVATVPLWTVLLEWLWLKRGMPRPLVFCGIVLGVLGLWILIKPQTNSAPLNLTGIAVLLAAAFSWAVGSIQARRAHLPKSGFMATGMEMISGGSLLLIVGSVKGEWNHFSFKAVSAHSGFALGYLILFGALIGFSAYKYMLKHTSPTLSSTYAYVNPLIAVFLGWLLAGELLTLRIFFGAIIIAAAVCLITIAQKPSPHESLDAEIS